MSLESKIEALTAAVEKLSAIMLNQTSSHEVPRTQAIPPIVAAVAPPVVQAPAPVVAPPVVTMPPPPVFTAPVPAAPTACPITDGKSLIAYVMEQYKALGQAKGAKIQDVLLSVGLRNVNDATKAHYPAIYAGVEALKAAA